MSNKDIARRLGLSPKTVMHHTSAIYRKLGVRGRSEATSTAIRMGLTDL
jgi:DNA-binding NarL/FixJ family response regulator